MTTNPSKLDEIAARVEAFETHGTPGRRAPEDRKVLLAAIQAVKAVHEPVDALMYTGKSQHHKVKVCVGCGQDDGNWQQWPCPTIRAIRGAFQ